MSQSLNQILFEQLDSIVLIDSHSHINPHSPTSTSLADLLGYHYYTELAHSSGMPKHLIEEPGISPREKVGRLFEYLGNIDNTVQWSWFVELSQKLFGFQGDEINKSNWETVYDLADSKMEQPDWESQVLAVSKVEKVFLTNDFDDPLEGFDTKRYVPCLRTDDLVFHLAQPMVRERLHSASGRTIQTLSDLKQAIDILFIRFKERGARACAISLPPWFTPKAYSDQSHVAQVALDDMVQFGNDASEAHKRTMAEWVFWKIAELAEAYKLPFDLMIGVHRRVYPTGVFQGQDLYDSRVSLIQYAELFNAFPNLPFPISVLASVTNQELVDYAWIFPNVLTHGHWWYSNTPNYIRHDLRGRIEAIPRNKQLGYYSDAYKLEFIHPKFRMYKQLLADVLAEDFCQGRGWPEEKAIALGRQILRGNVENVFEC
ncbi:MAG: glucuronate isomerase [Planctomycetota bacterium]|nr:glucuronate isomerase [Planctomycetota bacterium]